MKKFNLFFKSKVTKFLIILFVIGLFCFSFYKKNKQEVKEAVLLYTKGENIADNKQDIEKEEQNNETDGSKEDKSKISKVFVKKKKPKEWVDTKAEEYKQIIDRIKRQDKEKILKKYSFTEEDIKKAEEVIAKNVEATIEFQKLLKNEYNNKKRNGRLRYGRKVRNNDYIYVAVDNVSKNKEIQKKFNGKTTFFVIKIDSKSNKAFNKKLFGRKINDTVYLKIEDFLSEDKIRIINEARSNAQSSIDSLIRMYPYLDIPEYRDAIKDLDFSMKFVILDILEENFINKNNIKNKVFDYNAKM